MEKQTNRSTTMAEQNSHMSLSIYHQKRRGLKHKIDELACSLVAKELPPYSMHNQIIFNPYPTAFPYGNGMVLHFYQQQESSTTKTVHKVINKGLKAYV